MAHPSLQGFYRNCCGSDHGWFCFSGGVYISNRKQTALVAYRLEKLEQKVDKHNSVVERMYRLEEQVKNLQAEVSELKLG